RFSRQDSSLPPSPPSEQSESESQVVPKTARRLKELRDALMMMMPSWLRLGAAFLSLGGPETLDVVSPVRVLMEDWEQPSTTMWERTEQLVGMVEEAKREQSALFIRLRIFRPTEDAEAIQRALNESPVDQQSIIDILTRRVASQRAAISAAFADIDPDGQCLSEKARRARRQKILTDSVGFSASTSPSSTPASCGQALESPQADEASLIEILCSRTQSKIEAAKMAYRQMYGRSFAEDALEGISGPFKTLLNGLAGRSRPEGAVFDCDQARRDGRTLADEGPAGWAAGGRLTELLIERSNAHMRRRRSPSASGFCAAKTAAAAAGSKTSASMVKLRVPAGDHDDQVVLRVVISRCELDMVQIKEAFLALTRRSGQLPSRLRWRAMSGNALKSDSQQAIRDLEERENASIPDAEVSPAAQLMQRLMLNRQPEMAKASAATAAAAGGACPDEAASPDDENHVKATLRELVIYCCFLVLMTVVCQPATPSTACLAASGNLSAANATAALDNLLRDCPCWAWRRFVRWRVGNRTCKVAKPFRGVIGWCTGRTRLTTRTGELFQGRGGGSGM
uniref:Annexin n=1 Tax=Macrostomum lignano TaxID=282301 RepID=A0A1I8F8T1_9PLAT